MQKSLRPRLGMQALRFKRLALDSWAKLLISNF